MCKITTVTIAPQVNLGASFKAETFSPEINTLLSLIPRLSDHHSPPSNSRFYIITGGPGVGKTTLVNQLKEKGIFTVAEAATDVIQEDLEKNIKHPWAQPGFRKKVLHKQEERYQEAKNFSPMEAIFDRSQIDTLCFALYLGETPLAALVEAVRNIVIHCLYAPTVFLVEPLDNYEETQIRSESPQEARRVGNFLAASYEALGFRVVPISAGSIEERTAIIMKKIHEGNSYNFNVSAPTKDSLKL